MSKILLRITVALAVLTTIAVGGYWYWTTTPFFAFQEAALAVKNHDLVQFEHYVDSQKIVDTALNDVLLEPIEKMPGLTEIGRRIAVAAISIPVGSAEKIILKQIEDYVAGTRHLSLEKSPYILVSYSASNHDLHKALSDARQGVTDEFARLRSLAYERMQEYALGHPDGIVGRLFVMSKNPQQADVQTLLQEYGLSKDNFRGLAYVSTADDGTGDSCKVGLKFMSPKLGREAVLELELNKSAGCWRVVRLSNLAQLVEELDPSYTIDYQALIQSSVRGMDSKAAKKNVDAMTKRITESSAVKNLLQSWKNKSR